MLDRDNIQKYKKALDRCQITYLPAERIETFGMTYFNYYMMTELREKYTRFREGTIVFHKPLVILAGRTREMFNGFPDAVREYAEKLLDKNDTHFHLLGYRFQNSLRETWEERCHLYERAAELRKSAAGGTNAGIIIGEEEYWELAAFKYLIKLIEQSFSINVTEMKERGLFGNGTPSSITKEIDKLFSEASSSADKRQELGKFLLAHNLFETYEDRYFSLFKK